MSLKLYEALGKWFNETDDVELPASDGVVYLTPELIIKVHDFLISYFPSNDVVHEGVLSTANIDHAIRVMQEHAGLKGKKKERVVEKAAHYMDYMFGGHAFVDGNKRTGFVGALLFLAINLKEEIAILDYALYVRKFEQMAQKGICDENKVELKEILTKNLVKVTFSPAPQ